MKKQETYHRAHPVLILYYSRWVLLVGILPILRSVSSFLKGEFVHWSFGSWIDFLIIGAIVILGVLNWYNFTYCINKTGINIRRGVIISKAVTLDWDKVTVMKKKRPIYLLVVGGSFLKADTVGGNLKDIDVNLCITNKKCNNILKNYSMYIEKSSNIESAKHFKPTVSSILYLAFVSINNFVGIFYIVTLISQSGKILGDPFPEMIIGSIENLAKTIKIPVSPAAFVISCFLLATWAIGVIFTLLRYYKYEVDCHGKILVTKGGILSKQQQIVNLDKLSYINIRQNIASYFLNRFSLYVNTPGTSKERSDLSCVLPNNKEEPFFNSLRYLFNRFSIGDISIRPIPGSSFRFLFLPSAIALAIIILTVVLVNKMPNWKDFLMFLCVMILIPTILLAAVSFIEKKFSGIGKKDNFYRVSYTRFFILNTIIIEENKIIQVKLKQSIAQRIHGSANLYIYTISEGTKKHRCRNIKVSEIKDLMGDYIYDFGK